MDVSVIIPCFNAAETIGDQLGALAGQRFNKPFEVIVVDNGSSDKTLTAINPFLKRFQSIRIIDASAKQGAAYARNMGAKAATGKILLFCDADDVVADGWLKAMCNALTQYEFVAGRIKWLKIAGANQPKGRTIPQNHGLQTYAYPEFLPHAATANIGIRRAVHEMIGGFDESWWNLEDTDYCWRLQLSGVKLHFEPEAIVYMRDRATLQKMIVQSWYWGRYNVLLYKRYRSRGMPQLSLTDGIKKWKSIIYFIPHIRNKNQLENWLWRVAWNLGRLEGCLRYRVLAI